MTIPQSDAALVAAGKPAIFMAIAEKLALLGTCDRKQVGALIIRDGRCVSWGYNGAPPGMPHCSENHHGWKSLAHDSVKVEVGASSYSKSDHRDRWIRDQVLEHGCRNATHAEANALAFAARQGISTDDGVLFVTVSPCDTCSRLLIAAGIREVYYREEYRDRSGIELLRGALVPCYQL